VAGVVGQVESKNEEILLQKSAILHEVLNDQSEVECKKYDDGKIHETSEVSALHLGVKNGRSCLVRHIECKWCLVVEPAIALLH
jgi:hypothetical protein